MWRGGWKGFDLARRAKGWSREQWTRAEESYHRTQERHWYGEDGSMDDVARGGLRVNRLP